MKILFLIGALWMFFLVYYIQSDAAPMKVCFSFVFFFAVYSASNVSRMRKDRAGCEPNVLFSSYRESRDQLFVSDTGALRLHR